MRSVHVLLGSQPGGGAAPTPPEGRARVRPGRGDRPDRGDRRGARDGGGEAEAAAENVHAIRVRKLAYGDRGREGDEGGGRLDGPSAVRGVPCRVIKRRIPVEGQKGGGARGLDRLRLRARPHYPRPAVFVPLGRSHHAGKARRVARQLLVATQTSRLETEALQSPAGAFLVGLGEPPHQSFEFFAQLLHQVGPHFFHLLLALGLHSRQRFARPRVEIVQLGPHLSHGLRVGLGPKRLFRRGRNVHHHRQLLCDLVQLLVRARVVQQLLGPTHFRRQVHEPLRQLRDFSTLRLRQRGGFLGGFLERLLQRHQSIVVGRGALIQGHLFERLGGLAHKPD
mmetsp:Transcript_36090/g.81119  ORF Transcript_36090/g.81119 Transcript_36090/m.81119 type:complete len:338 (-) Transcript_36090:1268-2281(-)